MVSLSGLPVLQGAWVGRERATGITNSDWTKRTCTICPFPRSTNQPVFGSISVPLFLRKHKSAIFVKAKSAPLNNISCGSASLHVYGNRSGTAVLKFRCLAVLCTRASVAQEPKSSQSHIWQSKSGQFWHQTVQFPAIGPSGMASNENRRFIGLEHSLSLIGVFGDWRFDRIRKLMDRILPFLE